MLCFYSGTVPQLEQFHERSTNVAIAPSWDSCGKRELRSQSWVQERAGTASTEAMLLKCWLHWDGHICHPSGRSSSSKTDPVQGTEQREAVPWPT